jgi:hypothetical protein
VSIKLRVHRQLRTSTLFTASQFTFNDKSRKVEKLPSNTTALDIAQLVDKLPQAQQIASTSFN